MLKYFIFTIVIINNLLLSSNFVLAADNQTIMPGAGESPGITPLQCAEEAKKDPNTLTEEVKQYCGIWGINDLLGIITKVVDFIFGLVGAVALAVFFWSGVLYMMSGTVDKTKKAKDMMIYTAYGIIIIFVSYSIIEFLINKVLTNNEAGGAKNWNEGSLDLIEKTPNK